MDIGRWILLCSAWWGLLTAAPVGLPNRGNTCFFNASMQSLACLGPMPTWIAHQRVVAGQEVQDLENQQLVGQVPIDQIDDAMRAHEVFVNLDDLLTAMAHPGDGLLPTLNSTIQNVVRNRFDLNQSAGGWPRQEDAQEYLAAVLRCASPTPFTYTYKEYLSCNICGDVRSRSDSADMLLLPLERAQQEYDAQKKQEPISLEQVLAQHMAPEQIEQSEWPDCQKCGKKTPHVKWTDNFKADSCFLISLIRYRFTWGQSATKLSVPIQFSTDPIVLCDGTYRLAAIIVHDGSTPRAGHYYAYVRYLHTPDQAWYKCNDGVVGRADDKVGMIAQRGCDYAQENTPYLLFFVREADAAVAVQVVEQQQSKEPHEVVVPSLPVKQKREIVRDAPVPGLLQKSILDSQAVKDFCASLLVNDEKKSFDISNRVQQLLHDKFLVTEQQYFSFRVDATRVCGCVDNLVTHVQHQVLDLSTSDAYGSLFNSLEAAIDACSAPVPFEGGGTECEVCNKPEFSQRYMTTLPRVLVCAIHKEAYKPLQSLHCPTLLGLKTHDGKAKDYALLAVVFANVNSGISQSFVMYYPPTKETRARWIQVGADGTYMPSIEGELKRDDVFARLSREADDSQAPVVALYEQISPEQESGDGQSFFGRLKKVFWSCAQGLQRMVQWPSSYAA